MIARKRSFHPRDRTCGAGKRRRAPSSRSTSARDPALYHGTWPQSLNEIESQFLCCTDFTELRCYFRRILTGFRVQDELDTALTSAWICDRRADPFALAVLRLSPGAAQASTCVPL